MTFKLSLSTWSSKLRHLALNSAAAMMRVSGWEAAFMTIVYDHGHEEGKFSFRGREFFDVELAFAAEVYDLAAGNEDLVCGAASAENADEEFGVADGVGLRGADGGEDGCGVEVCGDWSCGECHRFDVRAFGRVEGVLGGEEVGAVGFDAGGGEGADDFAEGDLAGFGFVEGVVEELGVHAAKDTQFITRFSI